MIRDRHSRSMKMSKNNEKKTWPRASASASHSCLINIEMVVSSNSLVAEFFSTNGGKETQHLFLFAFKS